jgi:uncharacterized membrane protein
MPVCPSCGAAADGPYCPKCGTKIGDPPPPDAPAPNVVKPSLSALTNNVASALCYIVPLIGGIVFLVLEPYNRDSKVRFDALQSILLAIALLIIGYCLRMLNSLFYTFGGLIHSLYSLACVILWVYLALQAYQQKKVVLPVIGPLAERQP